MAFFSKSGKKSGICLLCYKLRNKDGECMCNSGSGTAECQGCGAKGHLPDRINISESEARRKIGCTCGEQG